MFNSITDLGSESTRGNSHNKYNNIIQIAQPIRIKQMNRPARAMCKFQQTTALDPQNTARYYNTQHVIV